MRSAAALTLLVVAAMATMAAADAVGRPVILVTGFAPFAGRTVNGSGTLANALDRTEIAGASVQTVIMPVQWGEPTRIIPQQVAVHHPIAILGLGEGHPDQMTVETVAANRAIPVADNAGMLPGSGRLQATGPMEIPARFHLHERWGIVSPVPLKPSRNAGGYLCNEALYAIVSSTVPVAGFVHVPPQGDEPDAAYRTRLMPVIRELLRRNLEPR